jgi:DegV family protein with EDD domain
VAIAVVTDSSCDLPADLVAEHSIEIVPLSIRFGSEELVDRVDLTPREFWARCASSSTLPETAAPSPGAFEQAFRQAAARGANGVVCVNLSSKLSATIQAAQSAAKAVEGEVPVRVVDSRSVTMGLGMIVLGTARAGAASDSVDEVAAVAEDLSGRTRVYGTLDTLENLKKGGRVGGAQAMLGTLLSIKPLLDISTGVVEEAGKPRTRAKALRSLADMVDAAGDVENLAVMHGNAPDVDHFLDLLAATHPREDIHVGQIGATIGVHGGPRVMGVTFQVRA